MSSLLSLVIEPAEECARAHAGAFWPEAREPHGSAAADRESWPRSRTRGNQHWLHWPGVASFRFAANGNEVTAVPYTPAGPDIVRETFYHNVLPLVLQALGREGLHASAVLTDRGVVGFCGHTQTGKSTLAYALVRHGLTPWSDDALVWDVEGSRPRAFVVPFEFRLRPATLSFFGHSSLSEVKAPEPNAKTCALAAICVMRRAPIDAAARPVSIEPLAGGRVLARLLAHAHCFDPHNDARKEQMLLNYLTLISRTPIFELRFQPSLALMPHMVDAVLKSVVEKV